MFNNEFPYTDFHELNLDWILKKIQYFEEYLKSFDEAILKKAYKYTDDEIIKLNNKLNNDFILFKDEVNTKINDIDNKTNNFIKYVNNKILLFENELKDINDYVQTILAQANEYTNNAINNNNEYIINETKKALSTVKVLNYFTGESVSIQEMFDYLCQFHLENSITYTVMSSRSKTYTEFNNMNMTYTELALNGGSLYV